MITFANRASAVLYGFLKDRSFEKPFLLPANVCPVVTSINDESRGGF